MQELTEVLQEATRSIESAYFHLDIDGGDPVYRERVYCYELYHQMRSHWPPDCPYYLNGEIDKAAHPILTALGASHAKPDLLVHQPGYMKGNYAIIEVKPPQPALLEIRIDLEKLALFVTRVGYRRAIYLHYGYGIDASLIERVERIASLIGGLPPIELWVHANVGEGAHMVSELKGKA